MGYRLHLSLLSIVLLALFLLWHFRARYIDRLPRALSSRLREYAPLSTFEDAAEQGPSLLPFLLLTGADPSELLCRLLDE